MARMVLDLALVLLLKKAVHFYRLQKGYLNGEVHLALPIGPVSYTHLCASCHMYVTSNHVLPAPGDDEINMLDQAFFVEVNSRLGCQIRLTDDLDGLEVSLAPVSV